MTSVTMALACLVDCRRAGVKSCLPVCHKDKWPSSTIGCDPLLFGLPSRLFSCLFELSVFEKYPENQKKKRENDTTSTVD